MSKEEKKESLTTFEYNPNKMRDTNISKRDLIKKYAKEQEQKEQDDNDEFVGPSIKKIPKCKFSSQ